MSYSDKKVKVTILSLMSFPSSPASSFNGFPSDDTAFETPPRTVTPTPLPPRIARLRSRSTASPPPTSRDRSGTSTDARFLSTESAGIRGEDNSRDPSPAEVFPGAQSVESLAWDHSDETTPTFTPAGGSQFCQQLRERADARRRAESVAAPAEPPTRPASFGLKVSHNIMAEALDRMALEAMCALQAAVAAYEDDYQGMEAGDLPLSMLREKMAETEALKKSIQANEPRLAAIAPTHYTAELRDQVSVARKGLSVFWRDAVRRLKDVEDELGPNRTSTPAHGVSTDPAAPAGAAHKVPLVEENASLSLARVRSMVEELQRLQVNPEDARTFRAFASQTEAVFKHVKTIKSDAKQLVNETSSLGLLEPMRSLHAAVHELEAEEDKLLKMDSKARAIFGATSDNAREYLLKAPTFTGDPSKEPDFFTFKRKWVNFKGQKHVSQTQLVHILLEESLQGSAKATCMGLKTEEAIFAKLHRMFGNVKYLLQAKREAIHKLKRCEGPRVRRREWLIETHAKLNHLEELAIEHEVESELYHSSIGGYVIQALPKEWNERFLPYARKKDGYDPATFDVDRPTPMLSAKKAFKHMMGFLLCLIDESTYDLDYELTAERGGDDRPRQDAPTKGVQGKSLNKDKAYVVHDANDATFNGEKEVEKVPVHVAAPAAQGKGAGKPPPPPKRKDGGGSAGKPPAVQKPPGKPTKPAETKCDSCSGSHTHAYYCPTFITAAPADRIKMCYDNFICFRCLRTDSRIEHVKNRRRWWEQHKVNCITNFVCSVDGCARRSDFRQWHMLLCQWHVTENAAEQDKFIRSCDSKLLPAGVKFFSVYPTVFSCPADDTPINVVIQGCEVEADVANNAIFMLQDICIGDGNKKESLLMFLDSGCMTAGVSDRAARLLDSTCVREGPTEMGVAGGGTVVVPYGDEQFVLPCVKEKTVCLVTALRMDAITTAFPEYRVKEAWVQIYEEFKKLTNGNVQLLEHLSPPEKVGGRPVDVLLGIRYYKHYPKHIFTLPGGLGIHESKFATPDGSNLILCGPHAAWNNASKQSSAHTAHVYLTMEARAWYFQCQVLSHVMSNSEIEGDFCGGLRGEERGDGEDDIQDHPYSELQECGDMYCMHNDMSLDMYAYNLREDANRFFEAELCGGESMYRCLKCRACQMCKNSDRYDQMSLREEREQYLIDNCVEFDENEGRLYAKLPFVADPQEKLTPNRHIAEAIFASQMKITEANEQAKIDVLAAHEKLRSKGYVVKLTDLPPDVQAQIDIQGDSAHYVIPWRTVFNPNSLSTPCRMVFDASSCTPGGASLNQVLAKGENRLIKLHTILVKFRSGQAGFTCDISMAYNQVFLRPEHFKFQLFLWRDGLDKNAPVELWVITTLIYGVRPSGNIMASAFNLLAEYAKNRHPLHATGAAVLKGEAYVDDILHPADSPDAARRDADSLLYVLQLGGMGVKGFTFSGAAPLPDLSPDGKSVGLVGIKWHVEDDLISAEAKPIFFGKPKRGKLPELLQGDLKPALAKQFTKRVVLSKMASLFDVLGLLTPLTVKYKLSFSAICDLKVTWDQPLPDDLLDNWVDHINEIQEARDVMFRRAVVPVNASSVEFGLVVSTDASQYAAAACVHARVPLIDGTFHAQLLCARSRVTKNVTIPKAELKGMVLGATLGHAVKQALGSKCNDIFYVTDSSICLFQLNQDSRPMETLVRNAVVEVRRLSAPEHWYHVESANNIADLATRTAVVSEIGPGSEWQEGKDWMKLPKELMPLRTVTQLTAASEDKRLCVDKPQISLHVEMYTSRKDKLAERYEFSQYIYDPCKYSWPFSVRVMSWVIKYVRCLMEVRRKNQPDKSCPLFAPAWEPPLPPAHHVRVSGPGQPPQLDQYDLRFGQHYYFYKATLEVKQFVPVKKYEDDVVERYAILHHTGRILDGTNIETPVDHFIDLEPLHFIKPLADRYSPVAYSVMLHAHKSVTHHRTASATLTESRSISFVLKGRSLANEVRDNCQSCRRFKVKAIDVEMGKLHPTRLSIAPAFYVCQVDLMGPFQAFCEHKPHRSTVKIWVAVYKCVTTCAIMAHVMQSYSASAFLQAYCRFGCKYGHPALMLIDQGTQLVSACENASISVVDLANQLSTKYEVGLQHSTCPARAHNYNGMVERGIREIKRLFDKTFKGLKLDILTWETALAWICNELNNMPIALGSRTNHLDQLDVITPSRLLLGRANRRAMAGYPKLDCPSRIMAQLDEVYETWWKVWRKERIADFIPQPPKWKGNSDQALQVGDVVVFLKERPEDHFGTPLWKLAEVVSVEYSADGLVRTCTVRYRNASQPTVDQTTRVSVRQVAIVHSENDLDLVSDLNEAAKVVNDLYAT